MTTLPTTLQEYLDGIEDLEADGKRKHNIAVRALQYINPRTRLVARLHFKDQEERSLVVSQMRTLGAELVGEREG